MTAFPSKVWSVDFEYSTDSDLNPVPICMVAREVNSGELVRVWLLGDPPAGCPLDLEDALYVAYNAAAEMGCHIALGWGKPPHILDLYAEFCAEKAGKTAQRKRLLDACRCYGIATIADEEKKDMQSLCLRGGPYTEKEKAAILDYCQSDVDVTAELLLKMWPTIDFKNALWRGDYGWAVAATERAGIPIDMERLGFLTGVWGEIKADLIRTFDANYGVYEGEIFKQDKFAAWVQRQKFAWPRREDGKLSTKEETFSDMAKQHPVVRPLHELRKTVSGLRIADLPIGAGGRNRYSVMPYVAKTGRNQPKGKEFIFAGAKWLRFLIKPEPGCSFAYIDWCAQEFGVAAYLSGDDKMIASYRGPDPHIAFAKFAGAVPDWATKESHPAERKAYKVANLGILMGMGEAGLTIMLDGDSYRAAKILADHRRVYPTYWQWSEDNVNHYLLKNTLWGRMGWPLHYGCETKSRTARNFKLQANGAEMMRLAAISIAAKGITIHSIVHDAFLVGAATGEIGEKSASAQKSMDEASAVITGGYPLKTDVQIFSYPGRFEEEDGAEMWRVVNGLAAGIWERSA
jgi:DNA polymerase I